MKGVYNLDFITDEHFYHHVKDTVEKYRFDIDLKSFNKNIIDPVKLTFDHIVYGQDIDTTLENEILRQLDKTNSNLIGYFHQNIFKYINEDWIVPEHGYDIINEKENVYVELKNKHNTMNSSASAKTYMRMQNTILDNPMSKCLLVEIIAKKSQNIPWEITLDGIKQPTRENIRRVSIDIFYDLTTGIEGSFMQLCKKLPVVIKDIVEESQNRVKKNTVLKELNVISDDLLTSLYLLAFKEYTGFEKFKL